MVIGGLAVILAGSVNVLACTSTIKTAVKDVATGLTWSGSEVTGASAYDTATVETFDSTATPNGTVSYYFFSNGTCTGTPSAAGGGQLKDLAPNSNTEGPLAAGSYAFQATYSDDTTYAGSTSACEPFTVTKAAPAVTTSVKDASGGATWTGSETLGASAFDTATVGPEQDSKVITGTVTYSFFDNGTCAGTASSKDTVTLSGGLVPNSSTEGPLGVSSYSFEASYSGDSNYAAATGSCEPLSVGKAVAVVTTWVKDASDGATWTGSEATGASAYDTATVGPEQDSAVITGSVTYSFFLNGSCTGTASSTDKVTLSGGTVPKSSTEGPLGAGSYSFLASYSGDSNYAAATGSCEPLSVGKAVVAVTTGVKAADGTAWTSSEPLGVSAYDTATVGPEQDSTLITGTVTYSFFLNGTCTLPASATDQVTLTGGTVPKSSTEGPLGAGSYSFVASYGGDNNYGAAAGKCEPFSVGQYTPVVTTVVDDAASGAAWSGFEATGASAYDTATVGPEQDDTLITGTVTYKFFPNGNCAVSGDASPITDVVTMTDGMVPNSSTEGPLGAGSYSFLASYSGDSNYAAA
ncbi:MAG: hypothetical protein ACLQGJ_07900, partial [Candidatus Dormibacteria bacterium]